MTCRSLSILHPLHPHHLLVVAWKHRFSALCLSDLHNTAFGAKTPSYKVITDLDKKVRNFYTPPSLQIPGFGGSKMATHVEQPSVELTMQRYIAFAIREISEYSLSLSLSLSLIHTHIYLTLISSALLHAPRLFCSGIGRQSDGSHGKQIRTISPCRL